MHPDAGSTPPSRPSFAGTLGLSLLAAAVLATPLAVAGRGHSLYQFAFVPSTSSYTYGAMNVIPQIAITGAPADADWSRWAMLHDRDTYRLYVFKQHAVALYQFAFDGRSYAWGYHSVPELAINGLPPDVDLSRFAMLWDGTDYRFYARRSGQSSLYQAAWVTGTDHYDYGYHSIPEIPYSGFPADADWSRWSMLHDGQHYRLYAMAGSALQLYQAAFDPATSAYVYGHDSIASMPVTGAPDGAGTESFGMLYADGGYHLYLMSR